MLAIQKLISTALPVCGLLLLSMPSANAQFYGNNYGAAGTPSQGSLLQDVASGMLSQGQANGLVNRENSLQQRAAKLLRNDGGVLTPNDASKLNKEAMSINRQANTEMMNNSGGGLGTGILGSLFGGNRMLPAGGVMNGYPGLGMNNGYNAYGMNSYYPASYYNSGVYNGANSSYGAYGNSEYGYGYRRHHGYGY